MKVCNDGWLAAATSVLQRQAEEWLDANREDLAGLEVEGIVRHFEANNSTPLLDADEVVDELVEGMPEEEYAEKLDAIREQLRERVLEALRAE